MLRIFDIANKDLMQILRDRKSFMFLLLMPIAFTLLFGYAFGGFSRDESDPRIPVGYLDQDGGRMSLELKGLLEISDVIRLEEGAARSRADLDELVAGEDLAAAVIIPRGYSQALLAGTPRRLILVADTATPAGFTIENEVLTNVNRLMGAARTAQIVVQTTGDPDVFEAAFARTLATWQNPPVRVVLTSGPAVETQSSQSLTLSQTSPGMMLQFAIAGLLTAATIIVNERKSRALQRLLTTATKRPQILLGHYLAIFVLIFVQFALLITFGQLVLNVDYLRIPLATLVVALASAMCIAAMGLLIGVLAKTEDQATIFALIPMFVLAGLGGAWMPLEFTSTTFQAIGHISPIAWAMDGFKNIAARGLGFNSVLLPSAALAGYGLLFFSLAAWKFRKSEAS